jgi:hypothetical protein
MLDAQKSTRIKFWMTGKKLDETLKKPRALEKVFGFF